jgi:hypothetical protein
MGQKGGEQGTGACVHSNSFHSLVDMYLVASTCLHLVARLTKMSICPSG